MRDRQRRAMFARLNGLQYIKAPSFKANTLPVQVSTIVPSTTNKSAKISKKEFNDRINSEKRWFDKKFGGDTSVKTVGSYVMGKELIKEDGAKITASTTTEKYNKNVRVIERHILQRRKQWGQDTMYLEVEGQAFIAPKQSYIDSEKKPTKKILVT